MRPVFVVLGLSPGLEELVSPLDAVRVTQVAGPTHHQAAAHHRQELRGVRHRHLATIHPYKHFFMIGFYSKKCR
jgi:hypothetical protein